MHHNDTNKQQQNKKKKKERRRRRRRWNLLLSFLHPLVRNHTSLPISIFRQIDHEVSRLLTGSLVRYAPAWFVMWLPDNYAPLADSKGGKSRVRGCRLDRGLQNVYVEITAFPSPSSASWRTRACDKWRPMARITHELVSFSAPLPSSFCSLLVQ